jgi:hypothetical protein
LKTGKTPGGVRKRIEKVPKSLCSETTSPKGGAGTILSSLLYGKPSTKFSEVPLIFRR